MGSGAAGETAVISELLFREFNETQKVSLIDEDAVNPMALPRIMREMGDWLAAHHIDKVF